MKLNCDLGEGLDDVDNAVMPFIDMANIACGGHAGNIESMQRTILLAQQHSITIGAHPSYPDKANFGRLSLDITYNDLYQSLSEQIEDIITISQQNSSHVSYIKPHGALYNDLLIDDNKRRCIFNIANQFNLPVMVLASSHASTLLAAAKENHISLIFEAFADRTYTDEGHLAPRNIPNSVLTDKNAVLEQVKNLADTQCVITISGKTLHINADSICVHSDSLGAVKNIQAISARLKP